MDWLEILKFGATTGIFAALVSQGLAWLQEWWTSGRKEKASVRYLAVRVAVSLEAFSQACSDIVSDVSNYESSGGNIGRQVTQLPAAPIYPKDDDSWRALDVDLEERVLSLPNRIAMSQQAVRFAGEIDTYDDMTLTCMEQASELGIEAWDVAVALRTRNGFPPYSEGVKHVTFLREQAEKAQDRRLEDEKENARSWESITADTEKAKAMLRKADSAVSSHTA